MLNVVNLILDDGDHGKYYIYLQTPDKGKAEGLVEQASKSEDEKQKLPGMKLL